MERFAWFCSGTTNVSGILHFAEVTFWHFPDFVAPLSWNCRSSKCRLPLNVCPQFFFASLVIGILKILWACWTFPSVKWEFSICFVSSESLLSSLLLFSSLRFFFASLLFFSFQAILPSHHHSIFPLPLVSHVNCRWIERGGTLSVQFSSVVQNHIWVIVLLFFVLFLFSSCFILVFLSFLAFFLLKLLSSSLMLPPLLVLVVVMLLFFFVYLFSLRWLEWHVVAIAFWAEPA